MLRYMALLIGIASTASCSLISDDRGLEEVWSTRNEGDLIRTGTIGTDAQHFYVVRQRDESFRQVDRLFAFDLNDGKPVWDVPLSNGCEPAPASSGRIFCPSDDLEAFDAETGRALWSVTPDTTFQLVEGAADAERVYAGAFLDNQFSTIYAYDAETGALAWRRRVSGEGWTGSRLRSLVVEGSTLFASADALYSRNGFLSAPTILAYDAATGRELWRFQDGDGTQNLNVSALTVTDNTILYGETAFNDQTVALDRATREVRWRVDHVTGFAGMLAAPAVADGVVYTAQGDEQLYAIDIATGEVLWAVSPDRGSYFNHAVCGDYFIGNNTALTVVERATGEKVEILFGGAGENVRQMAERDGRLYVATEKAAYAFDCL